MINLFLYTLGATSILIQIISIRAAFVSTNYYRVRKALLDVMISTAVFLLASSGGVKGFFVAVIATFAVTIYLKVVGKKDIYKEEPLFWRIWRRKGRSE